VIEVKSCLAKTALNSSGSASGSALCLRLAARHLLPFKWRPNKSLLYPKKKKNLPSNAKAYNKKSNKSPPPLTFHYSLGFSKQGKRRLSLVKPERAIFVIF
jgi:hypothetical protein